MCYNINIVKVLESIIDIYFLLFLTVLPLTYIASTFSFFIKNKRKNTNEYKLKTKNKIGILLFLLLNIILFIIITLFVVFYDAVSIKIGFTAYYFICSALVILTYLITSIIEDIATDPKKYMKIMSSNLELSAYKDFIMKASIIQFIKVYIFISYIAAIILFQLESLKLYEFVNGFIRIIGNVCQNTITIILAFELLLKYKIHKDKEFEGVNKGSQLFQSFLNFSIKYFDLYKWFYDNFTPLLYIKDNKFYSKIATTKDILEVKLSKIRQGTEYKTVKISPKIKTYDIVFDTLLEYINNYKRISKKQMPKRLI